jgi:4'-phosphopantetheinyl transferase
MQEGQLSLECHVVARLVRLAGISPTHLTTNLNPTDRTRAEGFRFAEDRTRFLAGRTLLDHLFRQYLGREAGVAELTYTPLGRPVLANHPVLSFSITHSQDLVAVALTLGAEVGIDVESMERELDFEALAARIFSDEDLVQFRTLPSHAMSTAFFRAWTGKEAILKARGVGLFGGLPAVAIPWEMESTAWSVELRDPETCWRLQRLPVPDGYMGHVAWCDPARGLDFREITLEEIE